MADHEHSTLDIFIHGYATAYDILLTRLEKTQESLSEVMSIYMADESLSSDSPAKVAELSQMFYLLNHLKESFESVYFDTLDEVKAHPEKAVPSDD